MGGRGSNAKGSDSGAACTGRQLSLEFGPARGAKRRFWAATAGRILSQRARLGVQLWLAEHEVPLPSVSPMT